MSNQPVLTVFYQGWENYQQLLAGAVAPLTPEQLALRPSPTHWPIGQLVAHIIAARIWWFHYVLGEGDATLAPLVHWDDEGQPARSGRELAAGLEQSWELIWSALARWTPTDLGQEFVHPRRTEEIYSRQWVIWHVIEHDLHHGGEVSLLLGMHGLPTIDL